jgi:hypothetical protein
MLYKECSENGGHVGGGQEKGIVNGTEVLRLISERTLDIGEELCACFID